MLRLRNKAALIKFNSLKRIDLPIRFPVCLECIQRLWMISMYRTRPCFIFTSRDEPTREKKKTSQTVKQELHLHFNPIVEAGTIINRTARGIMGNTLLR